MKRPAKPTTSRYVTGLGAALPYLLFALPLLYSGGLLSEFTTFWLRSLALVYGGLSVVVYMVLRPRRAKPVAQDWLLAALAIVMLISTLASHDTRIGLFGIPGDYQGLLAQLGGLLLAYYAAVVLGVTDRPIFWRRAGIITGVVCIVSLLVAVPDMVQGYRLSGLLFHATGMSLYAVICLAANLLPTGGVQPSVRRDWRLLFAVVATIVIAQTGSRIGVLLALIVLIGAGWLYPIIRRRVLLCGAVLICLLVGSYAYPSPVQRVSNPNRVELGMSYRLQLYHWSLQQNQPSLLGVGAAQITGVINRPSPVAPSVLQQTFRTGYPLWYTHSQLLDTFIAYGYAGLLLLLTIVVLGLSRLRALWRAARQSAPKRAYAPAMILTVLLVTGCNFLVNTPSLELSALFLLALFSGRRIIHNVEK